MGSKVLALRDPGDESPAQVMRFVTLSQFQLFIFAVIVGLISGALVIGSQRYEADKLLPVVTFTQAGACVKVTNFENGHAFGCPDVDVLLRRYRKEYVK